MSLVASGSVESPYDVLGLDEDADERAIVDAYRRRVKEVHPDQGGSAEAFQEVKTAYERIQNGWEPGEPVPDPTPEPEPPEPAGPTVEYLNYEVIEDHGWSIDDEDLFEKADRLALSRADYGEFELDADSNESLLEAAEERDYAWPFACRGGACTNCAVAVVEGEMPSPKSHILPSDLLDRGIRLSCLTAPTTDVKIVYNVKHMPEVSDLLLPASRFEQASTD